MAAATVAISTLKVGQVFTRADIVDAKGVYDPTAQESKTVYTIVGVNPGDGYILCSFGGNNMKLDPTTPVIVVTPAA